jgi:hypothetical protein
MNRLLVTVLSIALLAPAAAGAPRAGGETDSASIVGVWTLNRDLSDQPPERPQGDDQRGRGGPGGRRGGGGFGRGGSGGGFPGGRGSGGSPEEQRRRVEAVRAIMDAPARLTIIRTDSLVIVTTGDGRTTRLSPDGKKIKDESTGIERKTKWDGDKLVTEMTGAGPGKITETYAIDREHGRLNVTLQMENSRGPNAGVMHRVYDRLQQ